MNEWVNEWMMKDNTSICSHVVRGKLKIPWWYDYSIQSKVSTRVPGRLLFVMFPMAVLYCLQCSVFQSFVFRLISNAVRFILTPDFFDMITLNYDHVMKFIFYQYFGVTHTVQLSVLHYDYLVPRFWFMTATYIFYLFHKKNKWMCALWTVKKKLH